MLYSYIFIVCSNTKKLFIISPFSNDAVFDSHSFCIILLVWFLCCKCVCTHHICMLQCQRLYEIFRYFYQTQYMIPSTYGCTILSVVSLISCPNAIILHVYLHSKSYILHRYFNRHNMYYHRCHDILKTFLFDTVDGDTVSFIRVRFNPKTYMLFRYF